ncbi:MAG: pyridoxal-phosphate dependent enzyme [Chloroflexi bacterium]|jgi:threonine dehydratase|nr:pyridoxal-phosphate dependent enzyme [Chloroflexota bacterium]
MDRPLGIADEVTVDGIREAAGFLRGKVQRTPLLSSATAARLVAAARGATPGDGRVYLKAEHLQLTGSFKPRGATLRIASLTPAERAAGVIVVSAGNHAQAVALAGAAAGVAVTAVMPAVAVPAKVAACRSYGAEVVLHGVDTGEAWAEMERIRAARGLLFIHPFDDPEVVTGQGTVGLEIVEDLPEVDLVVVGVGGGGLASGIAVAVGSLRPGARIVGVEPERSAALSLALAAGAVVPIRPDSVADGLNAPFAAPLTMGLAGRLLEGIVLVPDAEILAGVRFALERLKQVLEPAGAAALAALLFGRVAVRDGERVCVVLSGGNVEPERLAELLPRAAPLPSVPGRP